MTQQLMIQTLPLNKRFNHIVPVETELTSLLEQTGQYRKNLFLIATYLNQHFNSFPQPYLFSPCAMVFSLALHPHTSPKHTQPAWLRSFLSHSHFHTADCRTLITTLQSCTWQSDLPRPPTLSCILWPEGWFYLYYHLSACSLLIFL